MRKFVIGLLMMHVFFIAGCTYSVIMTATHGTASDVVDETATTSPTVSPTIEGIPGAAALTGK
jgi:hypothetical protein